MWGLAAVIASEQRRVRVHAVPWCVTVLVTVPADGLSAGGGVDGGDPVRVRVRRDGGLPGVG